MHLVEPAESSVQRLHRQVAQVGRKVIQHPYITTTPGPTFIDKKNYNKIKRTLAPKALLLSTYVLSILQQQLHNIIQQQHQQTAMTTTHQIHRKHNSNRNECEQQNNK